MINVFVIYLNCVLHFILLDNFVAHAKYSFSELDFLLQVFSFQTSLDLSLSVFTQLQVERAMLTMMEKVEASISNLEHCVSCRLPSDVLSGFNEILKVLTVLMYMLIHTLIVTTLHVHCV